ncbi:MAG TPA: ankyrin repeat domain-containing protein [Candidatus Saccharimonadales bacterium]|nr:ankyrin repeat domain-containing protein [Candidatus Saccharimonadales bacterium]
MRAVIRIVICLIVLQVVTSQSGSISTTVAGGQSKKVSRRSTSAAKNKAQQLRELMNAAANGDSRKVFDILDSGLNVDVTFERDESEFSGMSVLMVASVRGNPEMVEALIKRGANVNLKRYVGDTPLMLAAGSDNVKTVTLLLKAGADPNVKVVSPHAGELTPLTLAINLSEQHRIEIAETLLAAGAEINPRGNFFMSPLMQALEDLEMVKLLIAHGADVNQKNFRGATALMGAAAAGPASVVKYLIEKGADVNARDNDGTTALMAAEYRREFFDPSERDEIIEVLKRITVRRP